MPEIGEIRKAKEIKGIGTNKSIWHACVDCGKERWVRLLEGAPQNLLCKNCGILKLPHNRGIANSYWKGGRLKKGSYIFAYVSPDDFFYPMASNGNYVLEHRLIMAKHLNRCLLLWEVVHHRNGIRDDNRLENLELLPSMKKHLPSMRWQSELAKRDKRIAQLEARVILLEAELFVFQHKEILNGQF